ncbi:response regulator [Spirosoma telluris]|uniref:ATP-binding response regulator n=1 Tax=Spirosoma telluris TaxID=2183553 RepID=UPI002FC30033
MPTHILVIEDDKQIRENLSEMLTLHGFEIQTAANGREGISQALLHPPELILCDIMMPEVDGYQVLKVVRGNRLIANVPFIFLTAKTDPVDIRRGMNHGADDYLTKPFTLQNLLHTIESRLQREALRKQELKGQLETYRHSLGSVAAHEYNTALAGIIGFCSLLLDDYAQLSGEEVISMVEMIKVSGLRLKRSLDNIQLMDALQQLDPSQAAYRHFSSGHSSISAGLVDSYLVAVAYRQDREVSYELDVVSAELGLSEENLQLCLSELIDNAVKFSSSGQRILIRGIGKGTAIVLALLTKANPLKRSI